MDDKYWSGDVMHGGSYNKEYTDGKATADNAPGGT